jgi:hypothetical protein
MLNQMQARQREFQQQMQQMRTQARRSNMQMLRQTLGATEVQWQQLEPQLQRIERLKHEATVSLDLSCFGPTNFGGGGGMGGFGGMGGMMGGAPGGMMGGTGGGMMGGGQSSASGAMMGGSSGTGMMGGAAGTGTRPRGMGMGGGMGGFASGPGGPQSFTFTKTFQSGRPSSYKNPDELTDGDVLCEELLDMLQDPAAPAPEITRRVQALRALREKATIDLGAARDHLRTLVNPKQEATLILLAYLD